MTSIKLVAFTHLQACSCPTNSRDRDGNWTVRRVRDLDGDEGPQAVCEMPVSTLLPRWKSFHLTPRCLRVALYCVSPSRHTVSSNTNPGLPTYTFRCTVQGMPKGPLEVGSQHDLSHPRPGSQRIRGNLQAEGNIEKSRSLDGRLESYDSFLLASCPGSGESRMGSPRHA